MRDAVESRKSAFHKSLWLEQALIASGTPCPPLDRDRRTDVAIIGGGYVGLWTALELKLQDPGIEVVILEQDICGGGASGRNGGYALSWWTKAPSMKLKWGAEVAADLVSRTEVLIDELGIFCDEERIDAEFTKKGWVWAAFCEAHCNSWSQAVRVCRDLEVGNLRELSRDDAVRLSGTSKPISAVFDGSAAMLHPGKLVRGMREAAIRRGVTIYEHSPVQRLSRDRPAQLKTPRGAINAQMVVLATNAWAAGVRELSRSIVVVSSDMIATPCISERLERRDWLNRAGVNDSRQMVGYVRTTADGRLLAGKGGLAAAYGGRIGTNMFYSEQRAKLVKRQLDELYPEFSDVPVESFWSGPVDRSSDGLPLLGFLPEHDHILYGIGWSGNGVGPSRLGGRVLASLVLGRKDDWSRLPLVIDRPQRSFPSEPFRFLGGGLVRTAVQRKDELEARGRKLDWVTQSVAALAPKGVEDR